MWLNTVFFMRTNFIKDMLLLYSTKYLFLKHSFFFRFYNSSEANTFSHVLKSRPKLKDKEVKKFFTWISWASGGLWEIGCFSSGAKLALCFSTSSSVSCSFKFSAISWSSLCSETTGFPEAVSPELPLSLTSARPERKVRANCSTV